MAPSTFISKARKTFSIPSSTAVSRKRSTPRGNRSSPLRIQEKAAPDRCAASRATWRRSRSRSRFPGRAARLDEIDQTLRRAFHVAEESILSQRADVRIPADEALRIGLVERVVPAGQALAAATELARTIAAKAPVALRYAKEAVVKGLELPLAEGLRLEGDLSTLLRTTEDRVEGAKAFLEKRAPRWTGR